LQALRKKVEEGERRTADFRERGHHEVLSIAKLCKNGQNVFGDNLNISIFPWLFNLKT
jgi:hypothetical protein